MSAPSERTSLLHLQRANNGLNAPTPPVPTVPSIRRAATLVRDQGVRFTALDDLLSGHDLHSRTAQIAFTLAVLLFVLNEPSSNTPEDVWEQWSEETGRQEDVQALENHILQVWSDLLHLDLTGQDVQDVLWMSFPVDEALPGELRVMDFIVQQNAPHALLTHRLVQLSLANTWKHGQHPPEDHDMSITRRMFSRYDALATPRVSHTIELALDAAFLCVLVSYVVSPPRQHEIIDSRDSMGARGILLLIYSLSAVIHHCSMAAMPYALVLLAFLSHLASAVCPGDLAFDILLIGLAWRFITLHLPLSPTPLLLLDVSSTLPLSTILCRAVYRAFRPAVFFFMPALVVSFYLLSLSLADGTFLALDALPTTSPIETRTTFLALCFFILLLFLASVTLLVLTSVSVDDTGDKWDRFGRAAGIDARREYYRSIVAYASPQYFPPPFNLLRLLLIQLPTAVVTLVTRRDMRYITATADMVLWRVTIGPLAAVVGGIWCWGIW